MIFGVVSVPGKATDGDNCVVYNTISIQSRLKGALNFDSTFLSMGLNTFPPIIAHQLFTKFTLPTQFLSICKN